MRLSTYGKPRVFSCSDDLGAYLALPRGCESDLRELVQKHTLNAEWVDEMQNGQFIQAEFKGVLRAEQQQALNAMIEHRTGVLSATTAFGKTVVAAALIAARKVNTLVLVHRQQLLAQWVTRLTDFLVLPEETPDKVSKKGRNRKVGPIGSLGTGKNRLTGVIDVAIMQSLNSGKTVKACVQDYGMVIVDECHHVPALSFEQILKSVKARYVHGLTATTLRRDGRHPILFFQCGPTRFTVDAKKQALERPFEHFIIPRFTSFRLPLEMDGRDATIHDIYRELPEDEIRNELIVEDALKCYEEGRNSLILTGRVAHVGTLAEKLRHRIPNVMALTGGMGARKTKVLLEKLSSSPSEDPLMLVATGNFVGEGFDEPRLDTLFLAMPISWKGTLQQYAGRLHRLYDGKKEVQVYDYVDIHVPMLERMYGKRLKGYASIGYRAKGESISGAPADIIFNEQSFFEVYVNDIQNARREILVVSPFVTQHRILQIMPYFEACRTSGVQMAVIVRPSNTYEESQQPMLNECFKMLSNAGVEVIFKPNIHQKFAVIDRKVVWYGSVNLLGFGRSRESMMRLVSGGIAHQLLMSINAAGR